MATVPAERRARWTKQDDDRLQREYALFRDAGRLSMLARSMHRTVPFLSRHAGQLGLTNARYPRRWNVVWKYMSEEAATVLLDQFKHSRMTMIQFCKTKHIADDGFSQTMRRFFPDEWDAIIEAKVPRQTKYRYGRAFEYRVRDLLKRAGYFVLRSPRSGSPIDLAAIKAGQVLFIQCKRGGDLPRPEWNTLYQLALSVGAIPILAFMPDAYRGTELRELVGLKDGTKRAQPYRPFAVGRPDVATADDVGRTHLGSAPQG